MQVNLNPHYNQFKPSFKARLSDDGETRECLRRLAAKDPVGTLALRLMIESDDNSSVVGICRWPMDKWYYEVYGAKYHPIEQRPMSLLYGYAWDTSLKSPDYYVKKAKEILNANKNVRILEEQIQDLENKSESSKKLLKDAYAKQILKKIL